MSKNYENGIITSGPTDVSNDIEITGVAYFVNSVTGSDSNAGTNQNKPKSTLCGASGAYSVATANNGDVIIIDADHTETLTSSFAFSKAGIRVYGLGSGSSKPLFTGSTAIDMFDLTAVRNWIYNLRFPVWTTVTNTARINVAAINCGVVDCDFLLGANDLNGVTVPAAGLDFTLDGCTFTISANGPDSGIVIESASAVGLKIIDCSFDGGAFNYDNGAVYSTVAHTEFYYKDITLLNEAHIIHTAAAKGICTGTVMSDGSRLQLG